MVDIFQLSASIHRRVHLPNVVNFIRVELSTWRMFEVVRRNDDTIFMKFGLDIMPPFPLDVRITEWLDGNSNVVILL